MLGAASGRDLARAHRWKRMLEEGRYASISEMAAAEKLDRGYLGRILQLTLLAPDIVEAVLDGQNPGELTLPRLLEPFPLEWARQRAAAFTARVLDAVQSPICGRPLQGKGKLQDRGDA